MTVPQQIVPGVTRRADGRPCIPREPAALYAFATLIRRTESTLLELFSQGQLSGTTHTCIGQELCQMAVVRALVHADDAVLSNHRNHGHFLTYSGCVDGLLAEIMGRAGVCGGRGGSQHIAWRHFHSNGVQAGMTAIATGLALARQHSGSSGIVAVMLGDGTLGEGLVYESLNLAAVWQLPVLFVVEHNHIAQTTLTDAALAGSITGRAGAFGIAAWSVSDASDALWDTAETAVHTVRETHRPGFLVIDTRRLGPHSKGDDLRSDAELQAVRARDPLARLGRSLPPGQCAAIDRACGDVVAEALAAAMAAPPARPDPPARTVFAGASAPAPLDDAPASDRPPEPPDGASVRSALNHALDHLLATDPAVILLGEDLHDPYGGAFKVTAGLSRKYPGRVLSTPISEAALTGAAIGLALAGRRPIVEVMFADFLTLCADQIYNHAIKFPALFPESPVPLLIRAAAGGRRGYGPTHSQSPENLFVAMPGLTVLHGSHRHDMGRLLWHAVRHWPHPTVFFEHKLLYSQKQDSTGYTAIPADPRDAGSALFPTLAQRHAGADVAIVAYGGMVPLAEAAAAHLLEDEELSADLLLPALLAPLPRHSLTAALLPYPRVVIAEETHLGSGFGADLAACLLEAGYRGALRRVGAPPVPIPAARSLEAAMLPDAGTIAAAVLDML